MKLLKTILIIVGFAISTTALAETLSVQFEELTVLQFKEAVNKSDKTAIIPIGVFEKHGAHMPLGTDVYFARELSIRAAKKEYAVVFPWYYFGQVACGKHQPGTLAYSPELILRILQETVDELGRNGFKKIILLSGHGGNKGFLDFFIMSQLAKKKDYAVYWYKYKYDKEAVEKARALTMVDKINYHGGNRETSILKCIVPNLVDPSIAHTDSGADLNRLGHLDKRIYTGIFWYAQFPNHYAGDGSKGTAEAGEILLESAATNFAKAIKDIKKDKTTLKLLNQFYEESENPMNTKQPY